MPARAACDSLRWRFIEYRIGFLGTHFDDFSPGDRFVSKGVTFTEAAIIDFALRYDPQPFHIDVHAAAQSPYGGLIASGFHTLAQTFRMMLQEGVFADCSMGSPGMEELRWLVPVRPGDTLKARVAVTAKRDTSDGKRGVLSLEVSLFNQREDKVLGFKGTFLMRKELA